MDAVSISPFSVSAPIKPVAPEASSTFQLPGGNPFSSASTGSSPFASPGKAAQEPPPASEEDEEEEVPVKNEKPFKPHRKLVTGKRVAILVGSLLGLAVMTILFYPYDSYRPRIEATLSSMAGQSVRIAGVSASFSPAPTLVLSNVSVGMESDAGGISIAEVRAVPSIGSLFSPKKVFSRVTLRGTQVPMAQLGLVASSISGAGRSDAFSVGKIDIDKMTLALRDISFQDYSGHAELSDDGGLKQMDLRSKDGTMSIKVGPGPSEKSPTMFQIDGLGWKSGEGSPYVFDTLAVSGSLSGTRFSADKIEGRIFGGVIQGQLQLDWSGGMLVAGDVSVDYMSAPQLATALGSGSITVDGQASARIRFRASGESWSAISGKVPFEGSFLAKTGVINGLDFVEAVRRGSKLATRGGATRYENIAGKFRWDGAALQLSEIDLSSGVVRASGSVAVVKGGQLTGSMAVVLHGSATTVRTPVAIVGTLKDPQLFGGRN